MYKIWIGYLYIYPEDRFNNSSVIFCSFTPLFLSPVAGVPGKRAPEVFRTPKRTESEKDRVSEDMGVTLGEVALRYSCKTESLSSWTHSHTSTHSHMHKIAIYCENSALSDTFQPNVLCCLQSQTPRLSHGIVLCQFVFWKRTASEKSC